MSEIRSTILGSVGPLLGIAIAIVIVALIATMSVIGSTQSANLVSATRQIGTFLPIIGLVIAVAIMVSILGRI